MGVDVNVNVDKFVWNKGTFSCMFHVENSRQMFQ